VTRRLLALALLGFAASAQAYCIHNHLRDRVVHVQQDLHKDRLREDRTLDVKLRPGKRHCCRNLDCNPGGRSESLVTLYVRVLGDPDLTCAIEGTDTIKVTGDGTVRIMRNPRYPRSAAPYIVRIRSGQKDLTGPRGLPCLATKKGTP
jgi:hypothetical protein